MYLPSRTATVSLNMRSAVFNRPNTETENGTLELWTGSPHKFKPAGVLYISLLAPLRRQRPLSTQALCRSFSLDYKGTCTGLLVVARPATVPARSSSRKIRHDRPTAFFPERPWTRWICKVLLNIWMNAEWLVVLPVLPGFSGLSIGYPLTAVCQEKLSSGPQDTAQRTSARYAEYRTLLTTQRPPACGETTDCGATNRSNR
jgi:hypothetical protein